MMPSVHSEALAQLIGRRAEQTMEDLAKRVNIPINSTTPPALGAAIQHDPFSQAGKYGLIFVYIRLVLSVSTTLKRLYYYWVAKIRTALYKEKVINSASTLSPPGFSPPGGFGSFE